MINLFSCNSSNPKEIAHGSQQDEFKLHAPKDLIGHPINGYSMLHFIQYAFLSFIKIISLTHVLIISFVWELMELFIPEDWARESWGNKVFDVFFNYAGFIFGRKTFLAHKAKKSIST